MGFLDIFKKSRYFIVYFVAKLDAVSSVGDYSFISFDGKFINRDIVVAEIIKDMPNTAMKIIITGIQELNKKDFDNWIKSGVNKK